MPTNTSGGTTTSFNNTPQAVDDSFTGYEDCVFTFDVMANDLGGNAKILWSIDDSDTDGTTSAGGVGDGTIDLLAKDCALVPELSDLGASIWIQDGKIKYDTNALDWLGADETRTDHFTYAIRLANGTLSWATVTVTLTGRNDGPAVVLGGDDHASVTEDVLPTSASGSFAFTDVDLSDSHTVSITPPPSGYLGTLTAIVGEDSTGDGSGQVNWQFSVDNAAIQFLGDGETRVQTYTVIINDGHGGTASQTVQITIQGTNDAPVLTVDTSGSVTEDAADPTLATSGSLSFTDADTTDGHSVSTASTGVTWSGGNLDAGQVAVLTAGFSADSNSWDYSVANAAVDFLDDGETVVLTFDVTVTDDSLTGNASDTETVTITIHGTNDAPEAVGVTDSTDEDNVYSGAVTGTDVDGETLTYALAPGETLPDGVLFNGDGTFSVTPLGSDQGLDDTETRVVTFQVVANDGTVNSAPQTVKITINGVNDAPEVKTVIPDQNVDEDTHWSFAVPAGTFKDVDGEALNYSATLGNGNPLPGWLTFDAATQTFSGTPPQDFNGTISLTVTASDEEFSADDTFDLVINPVNDAPELTGDLAATVAEGGTYVLTGSDLGFTDPDDNAAGVTFSVWGLANGTLLVNGLAASSFNGTQLAAGQVSFAHNGSETTSAGFNVSVEDGNEDGSASVAQPFAITVTPVNDGAVITGATTGNVTEDAVPNTVGGNLNSTDADGVNDAWTVVASATASANGYGTYTIDATGNWVYALNNANPTVNALNNGGILSDSFTVTTADGTSHVVNITINGHTDVVGVTLPLTFTGTGDPNDFDTLVGAGPVDNSAGINGNSADDNITGGTAGQNIDGKGGNDTIYAGGGGDTVNGNTGDDTLYGQAGDDAIDGNNGFDTVFGGSGNDGITGGNDDDIVFGGSGNDSINGQGGSDVIVGGYGADILTGAGGNDTFVYLDVKDTNDTITDFTSGDKIDFSAIDANPALSGDQGFAFGGTTATAHGVWYAQLGGNVIVYMDTDGNASTAELSLTLSGVSTVGSGDFLLGP